MGQLNIYGRPWVVFNAQNAEHRRWFWEFQTQKTWGHCPVRFVLNDTSKNLINQIQNELIDYYVAKEFAS